MEMSPTIWFRVVMGVLGFLLFLISTIVATQNTGLSATTLVWLGIAGQAVSFLLASVPSFTRSVLPDALERAALREMKAAKELGQQ